MEITGQPATTESKWLSMTWSIYGQREMGGTWDNVFSTSNSVLTHIAQSISKVPLSEHIQLHLDVITCASRYRNSSTILNKRENSNGSWKMRLLHNFTANI